MRSFFSWVCCGRQWRVAFLRSTSAKHKLPPTFTSGGRSHDGPGISFKSTWMVASSFSSSTIILWRITQANMTLPTLLRFHSRAGRWTMVKCDCSTPKAHSTSFLAPSCCLLMLLDLGYWYSFHEGSPFRIYTIECSAQSMLHPSADWNIMSSSKTLKDTGGFDHRTTLQAQWQKSATCILLDHNLYKDSVRLNKYSNKNKTLTLPAQWYNILIRTNTDWNWIIDNIS